MKSFILILTLVLGLFEAQASGAKGKHHERVERLRRELNLSDDQLAKVKEIRKGHREEFKALRGKFKESRRAFMSSMKDPKSAKEDLTAKFEAFQSARDGFQRARFAMMLEMRALLTPEQLEKFALLKKDRWMKKGKRD